MDFITNLCEDLNKRLDQRLDRMDQHFDEIREDVRETVDQKPRLNSRCFLKARTLTAKSLVSQRMTLPRTGK